MIRRTFAVIAVFVCLSTFAFGWGDEGHMAINRAAAQKLPKSMPAFFLEVDRLAYNGPEPDRWRNKAELTLKLMQEPEHFIDLERTEGIGELPLSRWDYVHRLYAYRSKIQDPKEADLFRPEKVGFQPYIVAEIYGRLKVAFRDYRALKAAGKSTKQVEENAIMYAGWLGHYVADAANPLHTTIHYNGWFGDNPKKYTTSRETHWNFEGTFVHSNLPKLGFANLVREPQHLGDPWKEYLRYIRESHSHVEPLYLLEQSGAFMGTGTPEGLEFTRKRMAAGSQMLLNMWYTAWMESATPVQSPF